MDPFLSEIRVVPYNFAPAGWALCNGQILPISQYAALFSLLGTNYGGNGTTTFALPNLQGSIPIGMGQGPGLDNRVIGGTVGTATVTVDSAQMPAHNHPVIAVDSPSDAYTPVGNVPGLAARSVYAHATTTTAAPTAIGNAGGGQPHNNMQPYLCLNYVIALQGIYPPRS